MHVQRQDEGAPLQLHHGRVGVDEGKGELEGLRRLRRRRRSRLYAQGVLALVVGEMKGVGGAVEDYRPGFFLFGNDPDAVLPRGEGLALDLERAGRLDTRRAVRPGRPGASPTDDARECRSATEHGTIVANANLRPVHRLRDGPALAPASRLRIGGAGSKRNKRDERCETHYCLTLEKNSPLRTSYSLTAKLTARSRSLLDGRDIT